LCTATDSARGSGYTIQADDLLILKTGQTDATEDKLGHAQRGGALDLYWTYHL